MKTGKGRRLTPEQRERQIVDGAIRFFAEVGFEGQTRELARRLGITQPLLYRYFPSKESLIERVYNEVYVKRWHPHWETLIADRSRPLQERLVTLYREYTRVIFNYEWVRIFMFSGLKGVNITERYLAIIQDKIFVPVCTELRELAELPSTEEVPLQPEELELAWDLHGGIYYLGVRKWIYNLPIPDDVEGHIERVVHSFIEGTPAALRQYFAQRATP